MERDGPYHLRRNSAPPRGTAVARGVHCNPLAIGGHVEKRRRHRAPPLTSRRPGMTIQHALPGLRPRGRGPRAAPLLRLAARGRRVRAVTVGPARAGRNPPPGIPSPADGGPAPPVRPAGSLRSLALPPGLLARAVLVPRALPRAHRCRPRR